MNPVLVDANVLVAAISQDSISYAAVQRELSAPGRQLILPALCVAEATYLIERRFGPLIEAQFLAGLSYTTVIAPEPADWARIAELVRQYADFPLGGADASVVALAEKLDIDTILTLDRRHFAAVRPRHCTAFTLLPE